MIRLLPIVTSDRIASLDMPVAGFNTDSSCVCLSDIYDEWGKLRSVYLKVTLPEKTTLAGDLLRWHLAAPMNIPQPTEAFLCQVPLVMVEQLYPDIPWREAWQRDLIPGWATTQLASAAPPMPIVPHGDPVLQAALQKWRWLLPTMALDEWGENIDDNISNLIELVQPNGAPDFATLDGGNFLGGDCWTLDSIRALWPSAKSGRRRSKLGKAAFGAMLPEYALERMLARAAHHAAALQVCAPYLHFWLPEMLDDAELAELIMQCLCARSNMIWLRTRLAHAYS